MCNILVAEGLFYSCINNLLHYITLCIQRRTKELHRNRMELRPRTRVNARPIRADSRLDPVYRGEQKNCIGTEWNCIRELV